MSGRVIGPYRLEAALGSGGMGKVWRARVIDRVAGVEPGAVVALKIIHPHLLDEPGFVARFQREAQLGCAVRHENVVRTFACHRILHDDTAQCVLVMEYVEGQTLRAMLPELERVPESLCCHIGREIASALVAIHDAGIVHRDLKPENVLITKDRQVVKVMDLGVARLVDEALRLSQTGNFVGSVHYAAPEQFQDSQGVDGRADLHALGIMLYELSTGQHPYRADGFHAVMRKVLEQRPRRPSDVNPQLSSFFEEVVLRLLAKRREDRFQSARELVQILDEGEASGWWEERAQEIRVATRRPLRRIRIARDTALFGREAELLQLREIFAQVCAGEGRVLLLEGEAGIGKSRLIDEFVGLLQREGAEFNFLSGEYPPGGAATASGAFCTAYRAHFDGQPMESLPSYLGEAPSLAPAFAALLRGATAPTGAELLTKDSLQTVFVQVTRALARERPTIVLIEDLHFAPDEGRALFASLAFALPQQRVLLVGTTQPGLDERWCAQLERVGALRLSLGRLGPKDLIRLLEDAFHSSALASELGVRIALKSDGNPFFAFEIIRSLREGRYLARRDDGTWVSTSAIGEIQIPSSVLDLVNARVGELGDTERHLLDVAACCGFEFDPLLVGQVLGLGRIPVMQTLGKIEKRHRLVRSSGRRCVFDHHQVQEALYGSLSEILREEYHAAIAEALESQSGAATKDPAAIDGALCADLAQHFLLGGRGPEGLRYLDAALAHLERGNLHDAAARLGNLALATQDLVTGVDRCVLLLRHAERLEILGRRSDEATAIEEALALSDAAGDAILRAKSRNALGRHHIRRARHSEARRLLDEALAIGRDVGNRRIEAAVIGTISTLAFALGRYAEVLETGEQAAAIYRELGDRHGEAAAVNSVGNAYLRMGLCAKAREQHGLGLQIRREIHDRRGEAGSLGNLGNDALALGLVDEARTYYEQDLEIRRHIGDRRGEAVATGNLAGVYFERGQLAEARSHIERTLSICGELGERSGEATALGNLGTILQALGRVDEARTHHERHLAIAQEIGDRAGELLATSNLGALAAGVGRLPEAKEHHERALAISREIGDRGAEASALAQLGELADAEGDSAAATPLHEQALAIRRAIDRPEGIVASLLELGDLRRRAGDVLGARAALDEAVARARREDRRGHLATGLALLACLPDAGSAAVAAAIDASAPATDSPLRRLLLWEATQDSAHLVEARRLLEDSVRKVPAPYHEGMRTTNRVSREILVACERERIT